jgi:hypothetical protein
MLASLLKSLLSSSPRLGVRGGARSRAGWLCGSALTLVSATAAAQFDAMVPDQKPIPIEAFYEVLRDYGTWLETDRYGTLFCPHPDVVGVDFQPFSRGHWTMTEHGWTFVSNSKISWVTDHYGRWVETGLLHCNWAWLPGSDWGPAWVDFRVSDRVIAWRPKPYFGPRVQMRLPAGVALPQAKLPPELFSKDGRDAGFVAVNDNDFTARRIENVALGGSQLYAALRETEPLRDPRAGLHSSERREIVARIEAKRAAMAQAGQAGESGGGPGTASGGGAGGSASGGLPGGTPPEPARRRKAGSVAPGAAGLGAAGTVRAGASPSEAPKGSMDKWNAAGAKPGQTPPNRTNVSTGSSAGNPGELSGAKVFEWGGPEKKPPPKKPEPNQQ